MKMTAQENDLVTQIMDVEPEEVLELPLEEWRPPWGSETATYSELWDSFHIVADRRTGKWLVSISGKYGKYDQVLGVRTKTIRVCRTPENLIKELRKGRMRFTKHIDLKAQRKEDIANYHKDVTRHWWNQSG